MKERYLNVAPWFMNKNYGVSRMDANGFRVYGIFKETEKAIYAFVGNVSKTYIGWFPKSVLDSDIEYVNALDFENSKEGYSQARHYWDMETCAYK